MLGERCSECPGALPHSDGRLKGWPDLDRKHLCPSGAHTHRWGLPGTLAVADVVTSAWATPSVKAITGPRPAGRSASRGSPILRSEDACTCAGGYNLCPKQQSTSQSGRLERTIQLPMLVVVHGWATASLKKFLFS
jgi:hypothetical protein